MTMDALKAQLATITPHDAATTAHLYDRPVCLDEFNRRYSAIYEAIYAAQDAREMRAQFPDYAATIDAFDSWMNQDESEIYAFVCVMATWRQDMYTSDREAAAIMYTLREYLTD